MRGATPHFPYVFVEPRLIKHMSKLIITLVNNLHLYVTCAYMPGHNYSRSDKIM